MSSYDLIRDGKVVGILDMMAEEALVIADLSNVDHIGVRQHQGGVQSMSAHHGNMQMAQSKEQGDLFRARIITGDTIVEFKSQIDPVMIAKQIKGYEQLYEGLERRRQPHGPRTMDGAIQVAVTKPTVEEAIAYVCNWTCLHELQPDFLTAIRATTLAWHSQPEKS